MAETPCKHCGGYGYYDATNPVTGESEQRPCEHTAPIPEVLETPTPEKFVTEGANYAPDYVESLEDKCVHHWAPSYFGGRTCLNCNARSVNVSVERERDALKAYILFTHGLSEYDKIIAALSGTTGESVRCNCEGIKLKMGMHAQDCPVRTLRRGNTNG